MAAKEYTYRSVPLEIVDVQLFTETHVSGGGGSVSTSFGNVSGRTAPVSSTNITYQQVRMKQTANASGVEVMRSISLDGLAVASGQKLLAIYFEDEGNRKNEIAYINKSTNRFWYIKPLKESNLGNALIILGIILAVWGVFGEVFGLFIGGAIALVLGIFLRKSNEARIKTNRVRAKVIDTFMNSDKNVARRQLDDSVIFGVEETAVYN